MEKKRVNQKRGIIVISLPNEVSFQVFSDSLNHQRTRESFIIHTLRYEREQSKRKRREKKEKQPVLTVPTRFNLRRPGELKKAADESMKPNSKSKKT